MESGNSWNQALLLGYGPWPDPMPMRRVGAGAHAAFSSPRLVSRERRGSVPRCQHRARPLSYRGSDQRGRCDGSAKERIMTESLVAPLVTLVGLDAFAHFVVALSWRSARD